MKTLDYIEVSDGYFITVNGCVESQWDNIELKVIRLVVNVYKDVVKNSKDEYVSLWCREDLIKQPLFLKSKWKEKTLRTQTELVNKAKQYVKERLKNISMTDGLYDSLEVQ